MGLIKEFREFAMRGNVVDMAVGVIIGAAFGGIVKSMIDDILMPIIGIAGKADFSNLYIGLTPATQEKIAAWSTAHAGSAPALTDARTLGPILAYGSFITILINFLIVAFCIFLVIKAMNTAKKRFEKQEAAAPPPPPADVVLLTEIRDLLARRG